VTYLASHQTEAGWVAPVACDGRSCDVKASVPLGPPWVTIITYSAKGGPQERADYCGRDCVDTSMHIILGT